MTKRPCWPVVCRLLDKSNKDIGGVSALQHKPSASLYAPRSAEEQRLTLAGRNAPLCRALDSGVRLSEGVSREVAVLDAVDAPQGTDNAEQK